MSPGAEVPPVPDPTILTTEQLHREIENLKDLLGNDIAHEHQLCDVKFGSIADQFQEIARRTAEQKSDTKAAVDAALQAAKEAVASQTAASDKSITKSETSTAEQIKAVSALLASSNNATDEKFGDVKSRLDRIEAGKQVSQEARVDNRALVAALVSFGLFVIAAIGLAVALVASKP